MKSFIQKRIRQLERWELHHEGEEYQSMEWECASLLREVERHAVENGFPRVAEISQQRGGVRRTRALLSACLETLKVSSSTMTPPEIASQLRRSPDTVLDWIRSGKLKASNLNKPGKRPRYVVTSNDLGRIKTFDIADGDEVRQQIPLLVQQVECRK